MAEKKNNATKQAKEKAGRGGVVPPKDRRFGQPNGNQRNNGRWKKEDSISYQYNKILRMNQMELIEYSKRLDLTVAQKIAINRILDAIKPADGKTAPLLTTQEITDRTEGKARQAIDLTAEANIQTDNPLAGLSIEDLKKLAKGINL